MENQDIVLYTYRYYFRQKDSDKICLKVITDVLEGHEKFIAQLHADNSIEAASREYVCAMDCTKFCIVEEIKKSEKSLEKEGEV